MNNSCKTSNTIYASTSGNIISTVTAPAYTIQTSSIADSNVYCADIIIDGQSLAQQLEDIKKSLLIITRDIDMENKYPELKEAYDNYQRISNTLLAMETLTDSDYVE